MSMQELTCQELVELVTGYLEGTLSQQDRLRFAAHLAVCTSCRTYIQQMRQMIQLSGRLTEDALQPNARQQLLDVFRAWKHK